MKIAFTTLGCKLNFAESSALGKALTQRGHVRAKQGEEADVCIINTCSVTDAADHKDRQAIHRIRRQNPNAILIVTGCYAQLKPGEIAGFPEVDYVLGQDEKFAIPDLVERLEHSPYEATVQTSAIREVDAFHGAYSKDDRTRCFLKVQDGCNYFCTYCTIPLARGKSRNPSIASLADEAAHAVQDGAKEIVLTGVNIGDFGRTTGETFIDLLQVLDTLPTDLPYRIRISSCEPNLLSDEVIDFVAQSRHFAPHFHIPLQSGSNEVLKIMHRRYTRELFAERVEHIRRVMPNAFIGVDCMVGVRGETDEYWADYLQFISDLPVSQLHVFTYSERAHTRMLEMDLYVVPTKERERRSKVLGQDEKFAIPDLVERLEHSPYEATVQTSAIREVDAFHGAYSKDDRTRCFLKVQDGCNYFCTYCTIPLARGKSRNPSIASLADEAAHAVQDGAKEIVLTGVNIGDFGRTTGETFIDLLQVLDTLPTDLPYRIRISSCEPNLLSDEVIDFVAQSRHFAPHFHIPLQSGSNEVLKIMHRRYTRELFAERVEHIRRVMPNAFIGVDCMVGVRGETDEYWADYLQFISDLPVSQLHVFTYSERAHTRMLEMDLYVVPTKERERRSKVLHQVSADKLAAFYRAHAGETATVLWESKRIRVSENEYRMDGFTENYIRVSRPYDKSKINTFERLQIPNDIAP